MIRRLLLAVLLLAAPAAWAHDLDLTLIKLFESRGSARLEVTTPLSRFVKTAGLGAQPSPAELDIAVRSRLRFADDVPSALNVDSQADLLTWSAPLPPGSKPATVRFDQSSEAARTLAATYRDGRLVSEQVLDAAVPEPTAFGMLGAGTSHILSGLDHILFILGLALLGGSWKSLLKVLTCFTLAHSLTLTLASLGLVHGVPRIVEPLIALSIVALAVEGLRKNREKSDWVRMGLAFCFGLIHGLGFAGGLADLGARSELLVRSLVSFSCGIELGQLMILVPAVFALAGLSRLSQERARHLSLVCSALLGMVGSFWFVERLI